MRASGSGSNECWTSGDGNECWMSSDGNDVGSGGGDIEREGERQWGGQAAEGRGERSLSL